MVYGLSSASAAYGPERGLGIGVEGEEVLGPDKIRMMDWG